MTDRRLIEVAFPRKLPPEMPVARVRDAAGGEPVQEAAEFERCMRVIVLLNRQCQAEHTSTPGSARTETLAEAAWTGEQVDNRNLPLPTSQGFADSTHTPVTARTTRAAAPAL